MVSTVVLLLVLVAAAMHATWNFLVKASADRLLDTVGLAVGGGLIALLLVPWLPLPLAPSWPWLGASVLLHVVYFLLLAACYRHADLSVAYPLMRGLGPVFVALAAPLLGEPMTPPLVAGVALIGAGILLPAGVGLIRRHRLAGIGYPLLNAVVIGCYTLVDGLGVRQAGGAATYVLWLFLLNGGAVLAVALGLRGLALPAALAARWRPALTGAGLSVGAYGIVLWAMTVAPVAAVAALREVSIVFAALLGTFVLKEPMGRWRAAGAVLVAAGVVVVRGA